MVLNSILQGVRNLIKNIQLPELEHLRTAITQYGSRTNPSFQPNAGRWICITKQTIMVARLMPVGPDVNRYVASAAGFDPLTGIFSKRQLAAGYLH